jgi:hypothetical protein
LAVKVLVLTANQRDTIDQERKWSENGGSPVSKKTILSIFLIVLGVSAGMLVIFAYAMSGGKASITLVFLGTAIACIIAGTILAFSQLLDRFAGPFLDEIHKDIEDDIRDLKEHRITEPIWMILMIGIAVPAFTFFVFRFHKVEAVWGSIPVVLPTLAGIGILAWFIPRTRWFQNYRGYTPMWVFLIPTAGLIFTIMVGIGQTENSGTIRSSRQETIEYNTYQYTGFIIDRVSDFGFLLDFLSCSGEDCVVSLVIGLVVLTFILVAGSALIPHFWLFSGSILLSIMALIAIHDLLIRQS